MVCNQLSINLKFSVLHMDLTGDFSLFMTVADEISGKKVQDSINNFLKTTFSLMKQNFDKFFNGQLPISMKMLDFTLANETSVNENTFWKTIITTFRFSSPLTLFHAMEKLNTKINSSMVIHVIGTNLLDFEQTFLWAFLFYHVEQIESLKIIFIDGEFLNFLESPLNYAWLKMKLIIEGHAMGYDQYCRSAKFDKPDVIFGRSLIIHERKFSTPEKLWKSTILAVEKVQVPFILTSETRERAESDHETICQLLGKSVNFEFLEENPYASLFPERDHETAGVMYMNKYVIAYNWKLANSTEENEEIHKLLLELEDDHCEINENDANDEENSKSEEAIPETQEIMKKDLESESERKNILPENSKIEIAETSEKIVLDEIFKLKNAGCRIEENYRKAEEEAIPEMEKLIQGNEAEKTIFNCGKLNIEFEEGSLFEKENQEEDEKSREKTSASQDGSNVKEVNFKDREIIKNDLKIESENPKNFTNSTSENELQKINNLESEMELLDSQENDSKSIETISAARETNEKIRENGQEKNQENGPEKNKEEPEKMNTIPGNPNTIEIENESLPEKVKESEKIETERKQPEHAGNHSKADPTKKKVEKKPKNQKLKKGNSPQTTPETKEIPSKKMDKKSSPKKVKEIVQVEKKQSASQKNDTKTVDSKKDTHKTGEKSKKNILENLTIESKEKSLASKIDKNDSKSKRKRTKSEEDNPKAKKVISERKEIVEEKQEDSANLNAENKSESSEKMNNEISQSKIKFSESKENDFKSEEIVLQTNEIEKHRESEETNISSANLNTENEKSPGKIDKIEESYSTSQETKNNYSKSPIQYPVTSVQELKNFFQKLKENSIPEPKEVDKKPENGSAKTSIEKLIIEIEQNSETEKMNKNEKSQTEELFEHGENDFKAKEVIPEVKGIDIEKNDETRQENTKNVENEKAEFEENNLTAAEVISKREEVVLETKRINSKTRDSEADEIVAGTEEIINETEDDASGEIKVACDDSNRESTLVKSSESSTEQNSRFRVEFEKLKDQLDLVNTECAKLNNQFSVFQKMYPDFVDKN